MAALRSFLSLPLLLLLLLFLLLLLTHPSVARNDAPCQSSRWNNGFSRFLQRHVRSGVPATLDQNQWESYIRQNGGCDRPTQSFLKPQDMDAVKAVCSSGGGKVFKDNLCISRRPFSFVTVRSEPGTCGIRSVRQETKHLILACELLDNQCLPVHFEGNPDGSAPGNNARGCQDPDTRGHAPKMEKSWICLLSALPLLILYGL